MKVGLLLLSQVPYKNNGPGPVLMGDYYNLARRTMGDYMHYYL